MTPPLNLDARIRRAQELLDGLQDEIKQARAHLVRPRGGQQVPFFGEFAQVPPSGLNRLERCVRLIREVLDGRG